VLPVACSHWRCMHANIITTALSYSFGNHLAFRIARGKCTQQLAWCRSVLLLLLLLLHTGAIQLASGGEGGSQWWPAVTLPRSAIGRQGQVHSAWQHTALFSCLHGCMVAWLTHPRPHQHAQSREAPAKHARFKN
jgi:hypothetical protein